MFSWLVLTSGKFPDHPLDKIRKNNLVLILLLFSILLSRFAWVMEQRKITGLVPAADTKRRLHQSLASHSEAKLESIDIPLFCPLTQSRITTPVRGKNCLHIHCFDGESYCSLMWKKPVAKWKCPVSFCCL